MQDAAYEQQQISIEPAQPEDVAAMASVWRGGQAVTIDGAGHMVH